MAAPGLPLAHAALPQPDPSIFTFAHVPLPGQTWNVALGADPWIAVDLDSPFASLFPCCNWVDHPAVNPTELHCRYSWVHLLLHSCARTSDPQVLDSPFLLRYDLPSKLSDIWLALAPHVDATNTFVNPSLALKACLEAARLAGDDARLDILFADTDVAQPAPAAGPMAARWPPLLLTRQIVSHPEASLFSEGWLLWRCRKRFTNAARIDTTSVLYILLESARNFVSTGSPLLAPFLQLNQANIAQIPAPVASHLREWVLPVEMLQFPEANYLELQDASALHSFLFGDAEDRALTFLVRLPETLVHFPKVKSILLEGELSFTTNHNTRGALLKQLVLAHCSSALDPYSVETLRILEKRVEQASATMQLEIDPPSDPAQKVLYHAEYVSRLKQADKEISKQVGLGKGSSSKLLGVQTTEFRDASAAINALISTSEPGGTNPNAVFQLVFSQRSKLLIMNLLGLAGGVSGFPIFPALAGYRSHFGAYVTWLLATDDTGVVGAQAKGRLPPPSFVQALLKGDWSGGLDLYNACSAWEQLLANRSHTMRPEAEWFLDPSLLRVLKIFGFRLFAGIGRAGGDKEAIGSFLWVMEKGTALLESRHSRACPAVETEDLVAWWFRAALAEAGKNFADEVTSDTDFAVPYCDVFLRNNGLGCIAQLEAKLASFQRWEALGTDMPHTIGLLMQAGSAAGQSRSQNTTQSAQLAAFTDPYVRSLSTKPAPALTGDPPEHLVCTAHMPIHVSCNELWPLHCGTLIVSLITHTLLVQTLYVMIPSLSDPRQPRAVHTVLGQHWHS
jgi:hypothetical protein